MHNIKVARVKKKLTQTQLAEKIKVSQLSLSNYETGKTTPGGEILILLSKELEVTTDYLLGLEE